MAGTKEGGELAAIRNKERFGEDFYSRIGRAGGKKSRGGGFAKNKELAIVAGRLGGKTSRRGKTKPADPTEQTPEQKSWMRRIFGS